MSVKAVRPHPLIALTFGLMLIGCSALPDRADTMESHYISDTAQTLLGRELEPLLAKHPSLSGFHVLGDGMTALSARLHLIGAAEQSLDLQYYIWHNDTVGRVLYQRLLIAADRGVRVRLLLDDLDTSGKDDLLRTLDAHDNIEVRLFNPFANRTSRGLDMIGDTRRINHRMHNKTITADNQATIFGGRNIGNEYFDASEEVGFSDMDALAIGPIVSEVSAQFDLYWNSKVVYPLAIFYGETPLPDSTQREQRAALAETAKKAAQSEYAAALDRLTHANYSREITGTAFAWSRWILAYDQPDKLEQQEISKETHLAPQLKAGMDETQHELLIVSPYFVPGKSFTRYLVSLVERGVDVQILTNSLAANDVAMVHSGYMRYRKDLLRGGVKLYEFRANPLDTQEREFKLGASRASLHAKFFGFDRRYLFVGSFNLDGRSALINTELGAYFEAPEDAERMYQGFRENILDVAWVLSLDEQDNLVWTSRNADGNPLQTQTEPDTSWWQRFSARVMSWIVPERQL